MHRTFKMCREQLMSEAFSLVRKNEALGQQLTAAQSREREVSRAHAQQMMAKDAGITSLQSQMAKLIADKKAEVQKLQNMLKVEQLDFRL